MSDCDAVRERIADGAAATQPPELVDHLESCAACREAVEVARGLDAAADLMAGVNAPENLRARIKALPRLAPDCELMLERLLAALDGELGSDESAALLDHLHRCPACQATWEAFATLREIGSQTRTTLPARAALRLSPTKRLASRRRLQFFDLRLATAAAYLLAALTVFLVGNPANWARASSARVEKASVYAQAAVENRLASLAGRAADNLAVARSWTTHQAVEGWVWVRHLFGAKTAQQPPASEPAGGQKGEKR